MINCQSDYFVSATNRGTASVEELGLFHINSYNEVKSWQRRLQVRCAIRRRDYHRSMQSCNTCRIIIAMFPVNVVRWMRWRQSKNTEISTQITTKTHSSQVKLSWSDIWVTLLHATKCSSVDECNSREEIHNTTLWSLCRPYSLWRLASPFDCMCNVACFIN